MDRLAEAVREIKKLEGKLDAITAQSRSQASMMAVMPFVFLFILWIIDPKASSCCLPRRSAGAC